MSAPKLNRPAHPGTLHLGAALGQSAPLTGLLQRLQASRDRLAAISEQLPETRREQVRAGPLDDTGWSLLVPHGAAASKLRQLLPILEAELLSRGWQRTAIRIKVQSR